LNSSTVTVSEQAGEIRKLFEAASESEGPDREALLREADTKDRNIRKLVEQMLEADACRHPILDQPLGLAAGAPPAPSMLKEGDTIGDYRILRKIGEGGMSVVYLAESGSERFAIKNMLVSSPDFFRRFLQEETILRSLRHPHIARLVGSGQTENKIPYLVMEYVDGEPIHHYCKRERLSTHDCIALFRQVCAAVIYLHQHMVVHRDLKPGNILVTSNGTAKLLDFGIAKLLPGHHNAPSASHTSAGVMTPDYASPEQIRGLPVSTLTDVYTLGVLLYELLTGVHPFADGKPEMHETLRRICEDEPAKPSVASGRSEYRGEVDNIILKAMRKEPSDRYASVEQLDADLQRFLSGRPVLAQGASRFYQARKFVTRYRTSVVAAGIVVVSLSGGIIATIHQASVARQERSRAEMQARAAEAARSVAERERSRAEEQMSAAQHERANAERRLAELQKVAENSIKMYRSMGEGPVPPDTKALIASNTRDLLLTLRREDTLEQGLSALLDSASAEVRGYQIADATAAWEVPRGWIANQTNRGEYRVGIDHQFLYQGKPSLFLRSLVAEPVGTANVIQQFQAGQYRGARIRLTAFLQTASVTKAHIALGTVGVPENSGGIATTISGTNPWKRYDVVVDVPEDADLIRIVFGMSGSGTLWAANFGLERVSLQVPLTTRELPAKPENLNFNAR
jgi:hypothetical protein